MEPEEISLIAQEAHGFATLGMYDDALKSLESLPPMERPSAEIVGAHLLICAGLEKWESGFAWIERAKRARGAELAEPGGRFYLAYAEHCLKTGDEFNARSHLSHALQTWPEGARAVALASPLAVLWQ